MNLKYWGTFEIRLSRVQLEKKAVPFAGLSPVVRGEVKMESPDIKLVSYVHIVPPFNLVVDVFLSSS